MKRSTVLFYLVHVAKYNHAAAKQLLASEQVMVNGAVTRIDQLLQKNDALHIGDRLLKPGKIWKYYAYHKPRGIESTLNKNISANLADHIELEEHLFPVGRLDKASEGLMLLTNDGSVYKKTLAKEEAIEKEYIVRVDKPIDIAFKQAMEMGIVIMGQQTLPCKLELIDAFTFSIILIQGLNRQIRRMCYKLGYDVVSLKRIRIGSLLLGDLQEGAMLEVTKGAWL
jgi:23S rRNA pseudouridine2604 synthase